tara:strand:- start:8647 stop:8976 length:330 start_codon:yes stop_codon:yes gene_type:complete
MNKYNLDKLVKVVVNDFFNSHTYRFLEGKKKKRFWQTEMMEGIYLDSLGLSYEGKTLKNHTVKDNTVFENPEVVMVFQGGVRTTKYFNTLEEAKNFSEELTQGKNWLLN